MTDPVYDLVMVAHALTAILGFGALGATGSFAHLARRSRDPSSSPVLARFFRPGHNLAARAIFLVPVLGGTLLALGHGQDVGAAWPWIGLALWSVGAGVATAVIWPAERVLQRAVAAGTGPVEELRAAAARAESGAALCVVVFIAAFVVMIAQP